MGRTVTLRADGGRRLALSWYAPGEHHPAHRHAEAQLSRLLAGDYAEDSDHGPRRVSGAAFSAKPGGFAHENRFGEDGALMLSVCLAEAPFVTRYGLVGGDGEDLALLPAAPPAWLAQASREVAAGGRTRRIANDLGLHPVRFAQLFRRHYREAPSAWRQSRRLARAAGRIVVGREPLADLAAEAGFADQAHMSRAMKAATGFSPAALRRLFAD